MLLNLPDAEYILLGNLIIPTTYNVKKGCEVNCVKRCDSIMIHDMCDCVPHF